MFNSPHVGLPPEQFAAVFPFHLAVDRELKVMQTGAALARLCTGLCPGTPFTSHFRIRRPQIPAAFDEILKDLSGTFVLECISGFMRLKGQFVFVADPDRLVFLGSPVITSPGQISQMGLNLNDFAPHDLAVDLLFVWQAQNTALADSQALTEKLIAQREQLRRTNRQLMTQVRVTRALAESASLAEAAPGIIRAFCEGMGWDWGCLWRPDRRMNAITAAGLWHSLGPDAAGLEEQTLSDILERGTGLVGEVWESQQPGRITDIRNAANLPRKARMLECGIATIVAFPVFSGNEVTGVIEFLSKETRESDEELDRMFGLLGNQIGQFIGHKLVDEALRESREKYRLLFDSNPQPMWVYDIETLYFLAVNDTAVFKYGYSRQEFMQLRVPDLYLPEDHEAVSRTARSAPATFQSGPWRHLARGGKSFWVEIGSHAIEYNGRAARLVFANDITERLRAEETLQRVISTTRCLLWYATVKAVPGGDLHWEMRVTSEDSAQQFMPLRTYPDEHYAIAWDRSKVPEDKAAISEYAQHAILNGLSGYSQEFRCFREDGSVRWLSEEVQIEPLAAGSWTLVGVCTDVTERKQAEALVVHAREREIEIGSKIQETLLIRKPPSSFPGLQIAARSLASQRIDGDYFDFFVFDRERLDVAVGDVMGKGVPAALIAAASKAHFERAVPRLILGLEQFGRLPEPEEIVTAAHRVLTAELAGLDSFLTLCYASFDTARRTVTLVDCGHPRTVHFCGRTGTFRMLQGDNLPLGFSEREIYSQFTVTMEPGDLFFLYSDGVTEARDEFGEFFGEERLARLICATGGFSAEQIIAGVCDAVTQFTGTDSMADDLTCVAIKVLDYTQETVRAARAWEIRSTLQELHCVRDFVAEFCREEAADILTAEQVEKLQLAIDEAFVNIVNHAYLGRSDQHVQVDAHTGSNDAVTVRLFDWGVPFDPTSVPPPSFDGSREHGFGYYIIRNCVDEVEYGRDEIGRNCLVLTVRRQRN